MSDRKRAGRESISRAGPPLLRGSFAQVTNRGSDGLKVLLELLRIVTVGRAYFGEVGGVSLLDIQ